MADSMAAILNDVRVYQYRHIQQNVHHLLAVITDFKL